ncbi:hypothetical protein PFMALIP_00146, partial [Plasmodium falciparum MaliPS096_E11]
MAVKISTSVYKKRISSTAYPIYFSVFLKRLKNFVSERINKIKNLVDYEKPCRNLNYEIDEVKDLFCTGDFLNIPRNARLASWNKNIEDHLKATMVSDSNQKCKRSYPFYPRIQRYRRKLLADYCEERDKRRDVLNSSNDKDKCLEFNEWVIMSDNAINDSFNNKITEVMKRNLNSSNDKDKCLEFNEWVIMSDNAINDSFNNKITEGDRNKGAYTINDNCNPEIVEDGDGKKPEDSKNIVKSIHGPSFGTTYNYSPRQLEYGNNAFFLPRSNSDKLNLYFDSPIFGTSEITGTEEGFRNIFHVDIDITPTDVQVPFGNSSPVSIPTSEVTIVGNTPMKITPYLMFVPV